MSNEWNGEGVPPTGSWVEVRMYRGCGSDCDLEWRAEKVLGQDGDVIIVSSGRRHGDYDGITPGSYRQIRSEADRKRDEGIDGIVQFCIGYHSYPKGAEQYLKIATALYEDIASGKIPHITLK